MGDDQKLIFLVFGVSDFSVDGLHTFFWDQIWFKLNQTGIGSFFEPNKIWFKKSSIPFEKVKLVKKARRRRKFLIFGVAQIKTE